MNLDIRTNISWLEAVAMLVEAGRVHITLCKADAARLREIAEQLKPLVYVEPRCGVVG